MTPLRVHLWYTIQPIQSAHPQPSLLSNSHTVSQYSPARNHPRARHQRARDHAIAHSYLKLFKLSNPELIQHTYLASPIPSCENPNEGSSPCSFFSFYLLTDLDPSPCNPVWPASSFHGSVNINFLFHDNNFHVCYLTIPYFWHIYAHYSFKFHISPFCLNSCHHHKKL